MDAITIYRKRLGITQGELAEKLGVAQSSVGNWENGIRKPDVFMLKRIAEVLGCTTDDLLSEPEPATPALDKAE